MAEPADPDHQLEELCRVLNYFRVGYIVFGSHVARLNGVPVETVDVDVVPARMVENLTRLAEALNLLRPRWRVEGIPEGMKIDGGLEARHFLGDSAAIGLVTRLGPVDVVLEPQGLRGRLHRAHRRVDEGAPRRCRDPGRGPRRPHPVEGATAPGQGRRAPGRPVPAVPRACSRVATRASRPPVTAVAFRILHGSSSQAEIDALIGLARPDEAEKALAELEALSPAGPPSALVAAARLRGDLAAAAGHQAAAAAAFQTAWHRAQGLRVPLELAQLEISDARRLRAAGQPQQAVAQLRSARQRLTTLGARPYLQACDRELAAAAAPAGPETAPGLPGLTPAEQAVARLVGTGRTNRQAAAELYVSVKTVEFHLRHIFGKLGIRSRKDLITRTSATLPPHPAGNLGS